MTRKTLKAMGVVGATTMILAGAISASAATEAPPAPGKAPDPVVTETVVGRTQIQAAEKDTPAAVKRGLVREHLNREAKAGRLLDAKAVHAAALDDGSSVTWEAGSQVTEIHHKTVATAADPSHPAVMVAIKSGEAPGEESLAPSTRGSGMGADFNGPTLSNTFSYLGSGCAAKWWDSHGNSMETCWEKYRVTSIANMYEYGRWTNVNGGVIPEWYIPDYRPYEVVIGSRPRPYYSGRVSRMTNWFPKSGSATCTASSNHIYGGTISVGSGATTCQNTRINEDSAAAYMEEVYDATGIQNVTTLPKNVGLEFAMLLEASSSRTPLMEDWSSAAFGTSAAGELLGYDESYSGTHWM